MCVSVCVKDKWTVKDKLKPDLNIASISSAQFTDHNWSHGATYMQRSLGIVAFLCVTEESETT